ncbi:MAG: hypothetical protein ABSD57_01670 [Verrucomicrobiota bacterium]|jgi:hypothetical protein
MPTVVLLWVWFCAYLNCAGWTLSAIRELNARGYAVALLIWFIALCVWRKRTSAQFLAHARWQKFRRRFRRPFPLAFLILAALAFLGGALHPPTNYDALAYRIPRVLHWLAGGQWHWIHTIFDRLNGRTCGIEWVSAPFVALMKTDRWLFLINIISFLLLPGLVFSVFTRLGVRRRTAWHWMWIVPTGYCLVLQAGSIGNDLFGATFALAAVDFALRAKKSRSLHDFFASLLAAAMMTSAKMGNLPLLLPWAVALLPSLGLILRWPARTFCVCVLAVFASALPTMVLNVKFSFDWSGVGVGYGATKNVMLLRTGANVVLITSQNFVPPVFPLANQWNREVKVMLPPGLRAQLARTMESPGSEFKLDEMQIEENAGVGFGVSSLLLASVVAVIFMRREKTALLRDNVGTSFWQICTRWSSAICLLAFMTQSNFIAISREIVPFYALLLPIFLAASGHERLVTRRWWRTSALAVFLMAAGLLVISPARPLFPVGMFLEKIHTAAGQHPSLARVETVYSIYRDRNDAFAPARATLPPDLKILGFIAFDAPEASLWRPFGSRRIEHVCPGDTLPDLKQRGIEYVLIKTRDFGRWFGCSPDDWVGRMNAQVVEKIPLPQRAAEAAADWYLVKLP